ncbi:MAG: hypothetical protein RIQ52_282 [Pseudomonadota bacterium]|jgi:uncharacterized protein (TIGR03032 family)
MLTPLQNVIHHEKQDKPTLNASPGLGAWLVEQGGSLAFTTYQSARIFFISGKEDGQTRAHERIMGTAMGLAVENDQLWISNQQQIWRFANVGARQFSETHFDAVYMPRQAYMLGGCDVHDLVANVRHQDQHHELLFVNTRFSCVAAPDPHFNFRPVWKPAFVTALAQDDRCHLNGLCAQDGELAYVTFCGKSDQALGWRELKNGGGGVIDVRTHEIVCENLSMPHSPRWHEDRLWVLNSGCGDFGYIDTNDRRFINVGLCPGFARGLTFVGGYAVIGTSRLRENTFSSGLEVKARLESRHIREHCGLLVIDPKTGALVHWLTIEGGISELYDVAFIPQVMNPYTPGFSEPVLHQQLMHLPVSTQFPVAAQNQSTPLSATTQPPTSFQE